MHLQPGGSLDKQNSWSVSENGKPHGGEWVCTIYSVALGNHQRGVLDVLTVPRLGRRPASVVGHGGWARGRGDITTPFISMLGDEQGQSTQFVISQLG